MIQFYSGSSRSTGSIVLCRLSTGNHSVAVFITDAVAATDEGGPEVMLYLGYKR